MRKRWHLLNTAYGRHCAPRGRDRDLATALQGVFRILCLREQVLVHGPPHLRLYLGRRARGSAPPELLVVNPRGCNGLGTEAMTAHPILTANLEVAEQ